MRRPLPSMCGARGLWSTEAAVSQRRCNSSPILRNSPNGTGSLPRQRSLAIVPNVTAWRKFPSAPSSRASASAAGRARTAGRRAEHHAGRNLANGPSTTSASTLEDYIRHAGFRSGRRRHGRRGSEHCPAEQGRPGRDGPLSQIAGTHWRIRRVKRPMHLQKAIGLKIISRCYLP